MYEEQGFVFGTLVEIKIAGEPEARARAAAGEVLQEFGRLHRKLHAWQPGELATLNEALAQPGRRAALDPELEAILRDAAQLAERSGHLFNPALGKLVRLWGFHADEFRPRLPDPAEVARLAQAAPRMSDLALEAGGVTSRNAAAQLDLGGYAKGYALDLAARRLRAQGVRSALINIGGNVLALGRRGERPWRVGIQHPRKPAALATLDLHDGEAIGTSGDYQRYFEAEGRRYCHVIDPRSGAPVAGVQAATVLIAPGPQAGTLSDAASKPVFIEGAGAWRAAARAMGVEQALVVDGRGEVHVTAALRRRLEFLEQGLVVHEVP